MALTMAGSPSPVHSTRPASLLQLLPLTSCSAAGCRPAAGLHAEAWHTHSMGLQMIRTCDGAHQGIQQKHTPSVAMASPAALTPLKVQLGIPCQLGHVLDRLRESGWRKQGA